MIPKKRGAIITVGSLHVTLGSEPRLYAPDFKRSTQSFDAAKGAILNLTRALACEFAQHDITVNCISPGADTQTHLDAVTRENFRNMVPLGRLGVPTDLNGAVALFACAGGRSITGQNLTVDGGWSASWSCSIAGHPKKKFRGLSGQRPTQASLRFLRRTARLSPSVSAQSCNVPF